jgi:hypothetical protein
MQVTARHKLADVLIGKPTATKIEGCSIGFKDARGKRDIPSEYQVARPEVRDDVVVGSVEPARNSDDLDVPLAGESLESLI